MDADTKRRTIHNPRWWLILPIVLPMALVILVAGIFTGGLWVIGQVFCRLSNAVSPNNKATPPAIKRLMEWSVATIDEGEQ